METVKVKLYKNVKLDPTYKHLVKFDSKSASADYTMDNANIVKIGQKEAIRFDTSKENNFPSYYDFTTCKYAEIDVNSTPSKIYAFITQVDYDNPKTILIHYDIDYYNTYCVNNFGNLSSAFIERSGLYDADEDNIKQSDAALPAGEPSVLRKSILLVKEMTPSILVYYRALQGSAGGVSLNKYTIKEDGQNKSVNYTLKDQLSTTDSQEQISGSYKDVTANKLDSAKVNTALDPNANQKSELKYKQVRYDQTGLVSLFNDDALWSASGSTIVGAELREGAPDTENVDENGSYDVSFKSGDVISDAKLPDYLHKKPFMAYKLESRFGSLDVDPAQINANMISVKGYDSVLPHSHTIWRVEGYPDSSWNGSTTFVDTQDRGIDLFVDGSFGHFYSQRNRLNAKISNFIRSFNAKFDSLYASFATQVLATQNGNKVQKAAYNNSKFAKQATLKANNQTALQNMDNSNETATTNLNRSNSTSVSNFEAQTAMQQANLARSNEKSIDTLDNNLQLTNKNLDNSYNTQTNDIKISFDQQLSDSALGSLTEIIGKAPGQAIMTMLNGILTGGINAATAKAKLDNTINGTGATAPAGERTRAKDTNDNQKTNLNLTQQAQVDNLTDSRKVGESNLNASNQTAIDNLASNQNTAKTNLTNSQQTSLNNQKISLDSELASLENSLNLAIVNLYTSMDAKLKSFLPSAIAEAENFMADLAAEIADYQGNTDRVSSGAGFAYDSLKNYQISLNIYTVNDSTLKKAKNYAKNFGIAINQTKSLRDYFLADSAKLTTNGFVDKEFYLKTQNARLYFENAPIQAETAISDSLNNGCYLQITGSSNDDDDE